MVIDWTKVDFHFRLNTEEYTAHVYEKEILISEGYFFFVDDVKQGVMIDNHPFTVIHLRNLNNDE